MPNPVGPPGSWTLAFEDTFTGSSLNTDHWATPNGAVNSDTTMTPGDVAVTGGNCVITCSASGYAGCIVTMPSLPGWGTDPPYPVVVNPGDCVEASINFPGPSGDVAWNWPSFWISGGSWPANGEEDIFEAYNGIPSALNYNSPTDVNHTGPFPSGSWCNSFHTYTCVRGKSLLSCYWDGTLVSTHVPSDAGGPQAIIVLCGTANTLKTGSSSAILVDYVRKWTPSSSGALCVL